MAEERYILQIHNKLFTLNTDQLQSDYFDVILSIFFNKQFQTTRKTENNHTCFVFPG